jgi:hypothetical protein
LTLLDDGVEVDEVKYDKSRLMEVLSACWPRDFISKFSLATRITLERKKGNEPLAAEAAEEDSNIIPPSKETSTNPSKELNILDTTNEASDSAVEAAVNVVAAKKVKQTQKDKNDVTKLPVSMRLPRRGASFPKMELPLAGIDLVVGQKFYLPKFDIIEGGPP